MHRQLKAFIRRGFYRSGLVQFLVGLVSVAARRTTSVPLFHFVSYEENGAIGPLQQDEAIALFGITRVLRPKTVVEFGFFHGHSAFNFLQALDPSARLFSYDIDPESLSRAKAEFSGFRNFTFIPKSMAEFDAEDIGGQEIDLVFFDAAHHLVMNQKTFIKVLPHLAEDVLVVIHDTGIWAEEHITDVHHKLASALNVPRTPEGDYIHQPEEREFVEWLSENYPEFVSFHLHSTRVLRHGMTMLQRKRSLALTITGEAWFRAQTHPAH